MKLNREDRAWDDYADCPLPVQGTSSRPQDQLDQVRIMPSQCPNGSGALPIGRLGCSNLTDNKIASGVRVGGMANPPRCLIFTVN